MDDPPIALQTREFFMRKFLLWPGAALLVATLAACGGGGDDGGGGGSAATSALATPQAAVPVAQITDFDLAGAYASYLAGSAHYTVSGRATSLGEVIDFQGSLDMGSPVASNFNGKPTLRKTISTTLTGTDRRGKSQTQSSSADRHYDSNYQHIATTASGTAGDVEVVTMAVLPTKVQPGASGEWAHSTLYSNATLTRALGTVTTRYTVQRESDTTAVLTVIGTTTIVGARIEVTDRYRLQADRSMRQISQHIDTGSIVSNLDYR
ncbi:hypothetical protein [Variovorax sp. PvP013]|jgi:hypothetical protein|uniref:hypothetical protein n=1 Tax=Variovorax sp. PvP013 TaxID=3156435 RepID=UPI003D1D405A